MTFPTDAPDPTAVMGRRVVAALIDVTLVVGLLLVVWFGQAVNEPLPAGAAYGATCTDLTEDLRANTQCVELGSRVYYVSDPDRAATISLGFLVTTFLIFGVIQGLTGRTVGKVIMGLRTVGEDGHVPGIGRGILRGLFWLVDGPFVLFLPIGIVGFICALTTPGHRRVGDMASHTFVITKAAAGVPVVVPGLTVPSPVGAFVHQPGPQWDEARGAYIQWDPDQQAWLVWEEPTRRWVVIPERKQP
ncbi:MAG: RDD family protein [Acidimicrobiia bacterium]|nr:RDD family protein [Acidimicrobiia bacterium]